MVRVNFLRTFTLTIVLLIVWTLTVTAQDNGAPTAPPAAVPAPATDLPAVPPLPTEQTAPTTTPQGGPSDNTPRSEPFGSAPGGFSPFMSPTVGHAVPRADYRATWFPDEPVTGQPTNLGYVQQDLSISHPVWQDCANEWSVSANLRVETFHTDAILPNTRQPFPDDLWNVRFGTSYRHLFENDWIAGGSVFVGSASDKPFHSINEMTAGVNAFLRIPSGEHNAWLFTLTYSPTSELPIPLPGVAYIYQPSDQLRIHIGLPFQVMYRPIDDLTLDVSYMLLRTIHARATYRLLPRVNVYIGYDWANESYFLADRMNENDRFFYYDMRVTGGVQLPLCDWARLDLAAGYVFDRFYFEGQHLSDQNFNRVDVGDGPFVALQGQIRW